MSKRSGITMKYIATLRIGALATLVSATAWAQTPAPAPAAADPAAPSATPAPAPSALPASKILPLGDRTTPAGSTLTGQLDAGRTASTIQTQELDQRDAVIREVEERLNATDKLVSSLRQKSSQGEVDRKTVDAANAEYDRSKAKLQETLQQARNAKDKVSWERARHALAAEYAFYVASVGAIEVATPN